jgi:hypothetical protein
MEEQLKRHASLLSIARYYNIEQELRGAIDQSYHTKIDEGYIVDPLL